MPQLSGMKSPVWAKKGSTYPEPGQAGSEPAPSDAIISYGLEASEQVEEVATERDDTQAGMIEGPQYFNRRWETQFSTYEAASGTAGTASPQNKLLRACGFAETIQASNSVTYSLTDLQAEQDWVDLSFVHALQLHKSTGCRGSVTFAGEAGGFITRAFNFTGLFAVPTQVNLPQTAPTFTNQTSGLILSGGNTPTVEIGASPTAIPLSLQSFSIQLENTLDISDRGGSKQKVEITNRAVTAEMVIRTPLLAEFNYWDHYINRTVDSLKIVHGIVAGRITEFQLPKMRLRQTGNTDVGGIQHTQFTLYPERDAGANNSLVIVQR